MALPKEIARALQEHREGMVPREGGWYAEGLAACQGSRFHSPQPLVIHDCVIWPDMKITDEDEHIVTLCGVCRDTLCVLQELYAAYDGAVPWPVRREFGNIIRLIAKRGWDAHQAEVAAGG